jgi:non-homologous end joining protein Ku
VKGIHDGDTFTEVPDEEIVKGYEYAKGQHVLIDPKEIDDLKLEAKHTIDMVGSWTRTKSTADIGRSPIT